MFDDDGEGEDDDDDGDDNDTDVNRNDPDEEEDDGDGEKSCLGSLLDVEESDGVVGLEGGMYQSHERDGRLFFPFFSGCLVGVVMAVPIT